MLPTQPWFWSSQSAFEWDESEMFLQYAARCRMFVTSGLKPNIFNNIK